MLRFAYERSLGSLLHASHFLYPNAPFECPLGMTYTDKRGTFLTGKDMQGLLFRNSAERLTNVSAMTLKYQNS